MGEKCFTRMGQIGIAVCDIEKAGEVCKKYGMGPMRTFITTDKSVQAGIVFGERVDRIRFGTLMYEMDGVTFELLQPIENTIWNKFIEEQGEGVCDIMLTPTPRYYEVLKERGVEEIMFFRLYNHWLNENDFFTQIMRMHGTRKDLGFNIFSWDQTEEAKKRVYPRDQMATGAYVELEDGTEAHLQTPKFTRIERIMVVVENLEETREAYDAYGFGPLSEIAPVCDEAGKEKYRSFTFFQNTDGKGVTFEVLQPTDPESNYAKFLAKRGRGIYNVIFEQNPEYNNVIETLF
ncbi:MAG: hypothetical protein K5707_04760 [Clostridia bacterium]|nr:hypothetical protein [Clostridia bacterium]